MLPIRLTQSPIIDAVFDIRIDTDQSMAILFPGQILQKYPGAKFIKLPTYGIPEELMKSNPYMKYTATVRIELDDGCVFLCGEKMLAVGYSSPYPGWEKFSKKILEVLEFLSVSTVSKKVERIAIKYVDFIDKGVGKSFSTISTFAVSLNGDDLTEKDFAFRVASSADRVNYVLQLTSNVTINNRIGFVIDTDTVLDHRQYYGRAEVYPKDLMSNFDGVEYLHNQAKQVFFSTISEEGLQLLGAEYDD